MTTDSSDNGPLVLLDREAWRQVWRTVKKKAREFDAGITKLGEKIVAKCNQTPAITSVLNGLFQVDQIPPTAGKWVGRAGVAVSGYGTYRGYQWLLNSSLTRKVAATESDLLPFLDLLKLQSLRQSDYRDVLHFCIDRRFFVTQFPASPPHKFKQAVAALYELIQTYGTANETKFMDVEEFFASPEVQSLFFEGEDDYKLIECEFYGSVTKQKLDVSIKTLQELWLLVQNHDKIIHIFDMPYKRISALFDIKPVYILRDRWIPVRNREIGIVLELNSKGDEVIQYPVFRKFRPDDVKMGRASLRAEEISPPYEGVSCSTDLIAPENVRGKPYVLSFLPEGLIVEQEGSTETHCVIKPRDRDIPQEKFENLFAQIIWRIINVK
jgi:hypothetical protein